LTFRRSKDLGYLFVVVLEHVATPASMNAGVSIRVPILPALGLTLVPSGTTVNSDCI
jgi:hypothetical protein